MYACMQLSQDNVRAFVHLIKVTKEHENIEVKVKGKNIVIPADKLVQVNWKGKIRVHW